MKNKLTIKLVVIIVVSITLIVTIMAPIYFYLQPKMYIRQEEQYVDKFTQGLKQVEPFNKEGLSQYVLKSKESYRVYVFDKNYEPMYTSLELGNNQKFIKNLFGNKLDLFEMDSKAEYSEFDNEPAVRMYSTRKVGDETYYIYVKDSLSGVSLVFDFSNKVLKLVVLGYVVVCSIVLFLAISPYVKQIREVTKVAKNISENNLSVRYQGKIREDEIGELALSVNKMADTIQKNINNLENYNFVLCEDNRYMMEYEKSRQMLLRNITHDLKTPLAVISSQVEMIATCKEQKDKDYYFQSAMDEISKMSKMISNVLKMTVEERRIISREVQLIDVSAYITQLCNDTQAYINSCELELNIDISPNVKLNTIKEYVEFVFRNYLSNAVQNAHKNTVITVSLKENSGKIRLAVQNCGKQISDDVKDKIWTEAFTTLPQGRENTGLGLYIVKEISLKEHTQCGFDNTENGVRFWFDFIDYSDNTYNLN